MIAPKRILKATNKTVSLALTFYPSQIGKKGFSPKEISQIISSIRDVPKMVLDWRKYKLADVEECFKKFDSFSRNQGPHLIESFKAFMNESVNIPPTNSRKKYTVKEWSERIGVPASTIYGHLHRKGLKANDYFVMLRKAVVLPLKKDMKRFTVKEWAKRHQTTPHCIYSRLKGLNLRLSDYFRKNR